MFANGVVYPVDEWHLPLFRFSILKARWSYSKLHLYTNDLELKRKSMLFLALSIDYKPGLFHTSKAKSTRYRVILNTSVFLTYSVQIQSVSKFLLRNILLLRLFITVSITKFSWLLPDLL